MDPLQNLPQSSPKSTEIGCRAEPGYDIRRALSPLFSEYVNIQYYREINWLPSSLYARERSDRAEILQFLIVKQCTLEHFKESLHSLLFRPDVAFTHYLQHFCFKFASGQSFEKIPGEPLPF